MINVGCAFLRHVVWGYDGDDVLLAAMTTFLGTEEICVSSLFSQGK